MTHSTYETHRNRLLVNFGYPKSQEFIQVTAHIDLKEVMALTAVGAPNEDIGQALHEATLQAIHELAEMEAELDQLNAEVMA